MQISIPLFSPELLVSAILVGLGLLSAPFNIRLSVIGIGAGSVIMGAMALMNLPNGFQIQGIVLFGMSAIVGLWMMAVGLKKPPENRIK